MLLISSQSDNINPIFHFKTTARTQARGQQTKRGTSKVNPNERLLKKTQSDPNRSVTITKQITISTNSYNPEAPIVGKQSFKRRVSRDPGVFDLQSSGNWFLLPKHARRWATAFPSHSAQITPKCLNVSLNQKRSWTRCWISLDTISFMQFLTNSRLSHSKSTLSSPRLWAKFTTSLRATV